MITSRQKKTLCTTVYKHMSRKHLIDLPSYFQSRVGRQMYPYRLVCTLYPENRCKIKKKGLSTMVNFYVKIDYCSFLLSFFNGAKEIYFYLVFKYNEVL